MSPFEELTTCSRKKDKSALTYAYKISELVKLAYPSMEELAKGIIAKDYFVDGLHPEIHQSLMRSFHQMTLKH